jgi:ankyrin repeat protein
MSKVLGVHHIPVEVLDDIITHLIYTIGIYRAVALRRVDRHFNAAIIHAICVRRLIDVQHPATPGLLEYMPASMRGEIFLQPAQPTDSDIRIYMAAATSTNRALDMYHISDDERARHQRHRRIAENICVPHWRRAWKFELAISNIQLDRRRWSRREYRSDKVYQTDWHLQPDVEGLDVQAQNLLSAAIICCDIPVLDAVLNSEHRSALSPTRASWTPFFHRPLILAAATGNLELVRYLLNAGFRLDHYEDIVLEYAGTYNHHLEWEMEPRERYMGCPSMNAARREAPENVEWCTIAVIESHPLLAAVANQHVDIVRLFLQDEIKLRVSDDTYRRAILMGAFVGRSDLVELLLETIHRSIADICQLDVMLVHYAVRGGHVEMVAKLEEWGIDLTQQLLRACHSDGSCPHPLFRGQMFSSALQIAAFRGDLPMIEFVLSRKPDVSFRCWWQRKSPVEFAAQRGHLEAVELLLDHDADPSAALIGASSTGQLKVIKYLLDKYPSIVDHDYEKSYQIGRYVTGQRALIKATKSCNLAAMTMLVQAGANPSHGQFSPMSRLNVPTGRRPLEVAKWEGKQWVVDHLLRLGAKENVLDADMKMREEDPSQECFNGIIPSEFTWEWMSKQ